MIRISVDRSRFPSRLSFLILAFCAFMSQPGLVQAQHGTAETGYFPPGYAGDSFSGTVTAADDTSRELTLTYTDNAAKKIETFVGVIADGYVARWKDGTVHPLKPSDLPVGTKVKVYYMAKNVKVEGKKTNAE
jgi:hypothetical protein